MSPMDEVLRTIVRDELRAVLQEELPLAIQQQSRPGPPTYLSYDESADIAGVSKGTIANWVKGGKLQKCGGSPRTARIDRAELERLLAKQDKAPGQVDADELAAIILRKRR